MSKINACIIGYGSIGSKHARLLSNFKEIDKIYIFSKVKTPKAYTKLKNIKDISKYNIQYIVISNNTSDHYGTLIKINRIVKNKIILVEKPIFHKYRKIIPKNKIYVGYNMRFNPVIEKIKNLVKNKKIWSINIVTSSYLPFWRKKRDYLKTYSASKEKGGGVLLDLSHEIDYLQWIFGKVRIKHIDYTKISDLKISSEDYLCLHGLVREKTRFNLELSYLSKFPVRRILIEGRNISLEANLVKNQIFLNKENKQKKINIIKFSRDHTFVKMHKTLINKKVRNHCNLDQGLKLIKLMDRIRK